MAPVGRRTGTPRRNLLFFGLILALGALAAPALAQYETIVERTKPAVVLIEVEAAGIRGRATGTGFFIDSNGYMVTARHVIEGANRIVVRTPDGKSLPAIIVAYSTAFDGAVLKVEGSDFPVLAFGDSDAVRQGQAILAFGYPRTDVLGAAIVTVTRGIISAVRSSEGLLQIDAALNPGNSGGPIVNLRGEVVGVAAWRVPGEQALNFAVASNAIRGITTQLNPVAIPAPRPAAASFPLTGTWRGVWTSDSGLGGGSLSADFSQDGEVVTGGVLLTGSIFPALVLHGRFDGNSLSVDAFNGTTKAATLTGRLMAAGLLEGRYNVPLFLLWDSGRWGARKVGP